MWIFIELIVQLFTVTHDIHRPRCKTETQLCENILKAKHFNHVPSPRQNKSATVCRLWGSVTHQKMNSLEVGENLVFCSISSSWIIPDFCLVCLQEAIVQHSSFLEDFILEMLWNVQLYLRWHSCAWTWIKRKMWFACLASEIRHGKVKTFSTSAWSHYKWNELQPQLKQ